MSVVPLSIDRFGLFGYAYATGVSMERKRVLSLFSGCGGMDLGFLGDFEINMACVGPSIQVGDNAAASSSYARLPRTSFDIVFSNDILREARAAYVPYFSRFGQNHGFRSESIVELVKKAEEGSFQFPDTDIVVGGFPCQDFSLAGKRQGLETRKSHMGKLDPDVPTIESRGHLYIWMKRVIELTRPKVFVAENVKGLVSLGDVQRTIESDFRSVDQGYVVLPARVLHAGEYGVPQTRERVIFLGFSRRYLCSDGIRLLERGELDPYPLVTHALPGRPIGGLRPPATLRSVLGDLPEPELSPDPAQQSYSKARFYGFHVQGQKEIDLDGLGPTIRAEHHGNIEFRRLGPEQGGRYKTELTRGLAPRRLTVRECARIQTFPDDYEFVRKTPSDKSLHLSPSNGYKIIGNAVPPLLGFHIARRLEEIWPKLFGGNQI